jgi:hypothetical protein
VRSFYTNICADVKSARRIVEFPHLAAIRTGYLAAPNHYLAPTISFPKDIATVPALDNIAKWQIAIPTTACPN